MSTGSGIVKEVISGDTIKILGKLVEDGPPPEITITLTSVIAPRLKSGTAEENFAWESREYLRELCIGKRVNFRITQVVNTINRTFGEVFINAEGTSLIDVQLAAAEAGWVTLKSAASPPSPTDQIYQIYEAELRAKAAKIGLHAGKPPIRPAMNMTPNTQEIEAVFRKFQGKPTTAIIEYARDGGSLRVLLLDCWTYISISITGIICPRFNSSGPSNTAANAGPDPFAEQSRLFTQMRILNRRLMINIEGLESNGSGVFASILHPKGNIAVDILRAGLGKCFDRSLGLLPKETVVLMRNAETEAKNDKRGIWQSFTPTAPSIDRRTYDAHCVEVVSGDTIAVLTAEGEERRVTIAGIRVPRMGAPASSGAKASAEPWSVECRDMLISCLIGKSVTVTEEYSRPGSATSSMRVYASVFVDIPVGRGRYDKTNIAEHLLSHGMCTCVRYKAGSEEERVTDYDMLLISETKAVNAGAGVHGTSPPPSLKALSVNDMSSDGKKARQYFSLLQSGSKGAAYKGPATVEYVFSGSRFKVYIPYPENCCLQLSLAEVRCPMLAKAAPKPTSSSSGASSNMARSAEPFSDEARQFSRQRVMQRTVEIEITDMDKNGIALGKLFFTDESSPKESLALALVKQGLAKVDKYLANKSLTPSIELLLQEESAVKAESKGVWSIPEPEADETQTLSAAATGALGSKVGQLAKVRVSEIVSGSVLFVHVMDESGEYPTAALQNIEQMMIAFENGERPESEEGTLKKGQLCVSRYSAEPDKWFRAKVLEVSEDGKVQVLFVDYGNTDTVPLSDVFPCGSKSFVFEVPAQAIECSLAFLFVYPVNDSTGFGHEAAMYLNDLVWDRDVLLQVIGSPESSTSPVPVALYEMSPSGSTSLDHVTSSLDTDEMIRSVNEEMIVQGLARISRTSVKKIYGCPEKTALLNKVKDAQSSAIRNHVNMFRYGDPGDSDDEKSRDRPERTA